MSTTGVDVGKTRQEERLQRNPAVVELARFVQSGIDRDALLCRVKDMLQ